MTPADLRAARLSLGLSQPQMALMLGYTGHTRGNTLSKMERGDSPPTPQVQRLVRAYLDGYRPDDWPGRTRHAP